MANPEISQETSHNLPRINDYITQWARQRPDKAALVQDEDGRTVTYQELEQLVDDYALALLEMGLGPGDRVATMLLLTIEHALLMYACFKIGAICAPLDVRLKEHEAIRDLNKIEPKAFCFLGATPLRDFRQVGRLAQAECPSLKNLIQVTPDPSPGDLVPGAISTSQMLDREKLAAIRAKNRINRQLENIYAHLGPRSPVLIIYTTGTTGAPKPAVLSHQNILAQEEILRRGVGLDETYKPLVNLPPSHVGCLTETLICSLYMGCTAVLQRVFEPGQTLAAIPCHQITSLGMIPTQFRLIWAHPNFEKTDLSSLKYAIYGGASVDIEFLRRLAKMAPQFGTGLGMTEGAGFCTYTPQNIPVEEMVGQVGRPFPEIAPVTVRAPLNPDGSAGCELPDGETGEICYHPPQVFLGYYNQPEETAKVLSKEGLLYSGDLGYYQNMGSYRALFLAGRRKFIVKQSGYNVFPEEVEAHIAGLEKVDLVCVVGVPHQILGEGLFAFVRPRKGQSLTDEEVLIHCKLIASYKRPQYVEIWPEGKTFPLTRVAKVNRLEMIAQAEEIVEALRQRGLWDGALSSEDILSTLID